MTLPASTRKGGAFMDSRYRQDKEELTQPRQEIDEDRRSFLTAGLVGGAVAAGTLAAGMAHAQQVAQTRFQAGDFFTANELGG
eukprot:gene20068-27479_t